MKKVAVLERKERRLGDFFEEVTGKRITECADTGEIDKAIEAKLGHPLEYAYFNSSVIPRRGNVFPHSRNDLEAIDAEIDSLLSNQA